MLKTRKLEISRNWTTFAPNTCTSSLPSLDVHQFEIMMVITTEPCLENEGRFRNFEIINTRQSFYNTVRHQ
jgi:hypothetical protein